MSERSHVEKPFLDQLSALGWEIIDQGDGVPTDPTLSLRSEFREVTLKQVFMESVRAVNRLPDGRTWLTDRQLEELHERVTGKNGSLAEVNQEILEILNQTQIGENELTGERSPTVRLIDFENPLNNRFIAINQFRIDTPGRVKEQIRPDIVLFVNGLPLAVIECKDATVFTSNPVIEGIKQLRRYANQREATQEAGLSEGEERLFHCNQLLIATSGEKAVYGSITSGDEHFYEWKSIWPLKHQKYDPPLKRERSQERLIQGMLPRDTLLDIIRHFIIFTTSGNSLVKIISRYQQFRAVLKSLDRLREGKSPRDRSGVVWHTQGSGKSFTMVFLVRKMRAAKDLKDFKIVMINDRTDLEEQLGGTAALTGEKPRVIASSAKLKDKLKKNDSTLNMVMVHKFREQQDKTLARTLSKALGVKEDEVPVKFEPFGVVNTSERILILIDEAHRTQYTDLGDNLFAAFPNAARIAFTGTPLITDRHKQKTIDRFGSYIDTYKLQDAVDDGATVKILYEGKTADTALKDKSKFDRKFEDLFRERTPEELEAIKRKYGTTGDILEAEKRIDEVAADLVPHYIENILPDGFKAQVVCSSRLAAVRYLTAIRNALAAYVKELERRTPHDSEMIARLKFLKAAVVVSSDGVNEDAVLTVIRKEAKEQDAVESFKKRFDPEKPETGIAFLIVCDMLLTGFDAPIEQVMYLDKKLKEHGLLQAIARVNRVVTGKKHGLIVDYVGIARHLKDALSIYADADRKDILSALKGITEELPALEDRYRRIIRFFSDKGIIQAEAYCTQSLPDEDDYLVKEYMVELLHDIRLRAEFDVLLHNFLESLNIILPNLAAEPYRIPAKRLGYLQAQVRERYKDTTLTVDGAGEKVKKLINEHLISLGINPKIPTTELLSDTFIQHVEKHKSPKAKASEMEHAIRKYCQLYFDQDPTFFTKLSDKLESLIKQYKDDWDKLARTLLLLRDEAKAGRAEKVEGVECKAVPFYELIVHLTYEESRPATPERISHPPIIWTTKASPAELKLIRQLANDLVEHLKKTICLRDFWTNEPEKKRLEGDISDFLIGSNINRVMDMEPKLVTELMSLARSRQVDILSS